VGRQAVKQYLRVGRCAGRTSCDATTTAAALRNAAGTGGRARTGQLDDATHLLVDEMALHVFVGGRGGLAGGGRRCAGLGLVGGGRGGEEEGYQVSTVSQLTTAATAREHQSLTSAQHHIHRTDRVGRPCSGRPPRGSASAERPARERLRTLSGAQEGRMKDRQTRTARTLTATTLPRASSKSAGAWCGTNAREQ
jgi:hypothetical protein